MIVNSRLKKDLVSRICYHSVLELAYLIDGEHIIKMDDISEDLIREKQESYTIYAPGLCGYTKYGKENPYKEVKICIGESFIKRHQLAILHEVFGINNLQKNFARPFSLHTREVLAEIISDQKEGLAKRLFLESKILELLSFQLDEEGDKGEQSERLTKKLYKIRSILISDISRTYTIRELAREAGLNDSTVKKEFKRLFKETPLKYHRRMRMNKAKEWLMISDKSIAEIAAQVGYKNATHFCAAFKRFEGISPGKYRLKTNLPGFNS